MVRALFVYSIHLTKICILKKIEDVKKFHSNYSIKNGSNPMGIDWNKVKKKYSGIEIHNCDYLHENSIIYGIQWLKNWDINGI
ncbi:MAG: hypothetical protein ABFR32_12970 [Bacteroidota bacterium]